YCTEMSSCAEAHHHFAVCGEAERDADKDGIPCENVCGKTLEEYRRLRGSGAATPLLSPEGMEPDAIGPDAPPQPDGGFNEGTLAPPDAPADAGMACGGKRRCGQMQSCAEARFYLQNCGVRSLDRDGDGVPCESLCGG